MCVCVCVCVCVCLSVCVCVRSEGDVCGKVVSVRCEGWRVMVPC